jgi:rhodanese-related sulfurtransferase
MYNDIFPEEVKQWQQKGAALVDVRESWEYIQGHVPETKNIPMSELPNRLKEIPDPVVLVCASGNRSGHVALYLTEHGHTQVANLMGGTFGWQQRGLPIEK